MECFEYACNILVVSSGMFKYAYNIQFVSDGIYSINLMPAGKDATVDIYFSTGRLAWGPFT